MVLSFPNSEIMDVLEAAEVSFRLVPLLQLSRQGGGGSQARVLGPSIWHADVTSRTLQHDELDELQGLLESLDGYQPFFLWSPRPKPGPRLDPDGSILGASTVTLLAVNADNKRISLAGLPAGYALSRWDMLSFSYGSNPTNYALHRVVETTGAVADGDGETGLFEVRPHIRPGAAPGDSVTLVRPHALMTLVDGTIDPSRRVSEGSIRFTAVQHIRAG